MRGNEGIRNSVEANRLVRDTVDYEWETMPDGDMKRIPKSGTKIIDDDGSIKIENFTHKKSEVHSGCGHPLSVRSHSNELVPSGGVCKHCSKEYCKDCFGGKCSADGCIKNLCPGCVRFIDFEGITALLCPDCHSLAYSALIEEAKAVQLPPKQVETVYVPVYREPETTLMDVIKAPFKFIRDLF